MKIFRKYIIAVILCASLTFSAVCIFTADEAAKKVCIGDSEAVFVLGSTSEKLDGKVTDLSPYFSKAKEILKTAAGIAPPPINNIYYLITSGEP